MAHVFVLVSFFKFVEHCHLVTKCSEWAILIGLCPSLSLSVSPLTIIYITSPLKLLGKILMKLYGRLPWVTLYQIQVEI